MIFVLIKNLVDVVENIQYKQVEVTLNFNIKAKLENNGNELQKEHKDWWLLMYIYQRNQYAQKHVHLLIPHLRLHTKDDTNKNVLIFVLTDNCKIIQHMSKRWMMKKLFGFFLPRYSK